MMKGKHYVTCIGLLFVTCGVYITSGMPSCAVHTLPMLMGNSVTDTFIIGGYSSTIDSVTTYKNSRIRYCSRNPLSEGVYKFKGHLRVAGAQRVKQMLQNSASGLSYKVGESVTSRSVSYDEKEDITTIEIFSKDPFVLSLGKDDNSPFRNNEFKLISFSPLPATDIYNVHLNTINPCEKSSSIIKYHEPTMVVADDGTIIIAAYCEKADGTRSVLNTVSHDGGETWKTNWTSGILSMAWDRYNHRLCGIRSGSAFVSDDYGMSWKKIGYYDNKFVTDDMRAHCLQCRIGEKKAYEKDRASKRYSYVAYSVNTGNSGIQLENGVICMPMLIRIKKALAGKDDNGSWIVDDDGYCVPVNSKASGGERVVAYVLYSKDFGATWEHSPTTPSDIICEETCLTEVLPNQVCMNSRGGTESFWSETPSVRRTFIQHNPVDGRESFAIKQWDADWGSRPSNTIEDALVNADIARVKISRLIKSKNKDLTFWLFCNIYNPGSFVRKGLMLRLSTDCRNWVNVGYLTPSNRIVGGYCELGTHDSQIYLVYEGNRDSDTLSFARLDGDMMTDILTAYDKSKKEFPTPVGI